MGVTYNSGRARRLLHASTRAQIATLVVSFLSLTPRTLLQVHLTLDLRARLDSLLSWRSWFLLHLYTIMWNLHVVGLRVTPYIRVTWPILALVGVSPTSTGRIPAGMHFW